MKPLSYTLPIILISSIVTAKPIYQIPDVIVSDTRSEQSLVTTPASIKVINKAQINNTGAVNITELLNGHYGIQVRDDYGDGASAVLSMRGFGENAGANTLVLVDGRKLNEIDLGTPDLTSIDIADIERVEIIQGSAGTLFGDQAVGGVVNIITQKPQATRANISAGFGTHDNTIAAGYFAGRTNRGIGYKLNARSQRTDNYRKRNNLQRNNLKGYLDYQHNFGSIFIEHQYIERLQELAGALTNQQVNQNRHLAQFSNDNLASDTYITRLGGQQQLAERFSLEGELTHRKLDADGKIANTTFTQSRELLTFNPRLIIQVPLFTHYGGGLITVGADLERASYGIASRFGATDVDMEKMAGFAQWVQPLTDKLTATVGTRYSYYDSKINRLDILDDALVGEIGFSYQLIPTTRLYSRVDGNFRYPKVEEQGLLVNNTRPLRPQTGVSYELGAEVKQDKWMVNLMAYLLTLDNEIAFDPAPLNNLGFNGANVNLDPTRRRGVVVDGRYQILPKTNLILSYAYTDAKVTAGPFKRQRIPFVAKHNLRLAVEQHLLNHLTLFAESLTLSNRYAASDNANALRPIGGVTLFNAALNFNYQKLKASLRVNNLGNKQHNGLVVAFMNQHQFYPAPTRTILLTVAYDIL